MVWFAQDMQELIRCPAFCSKLVITSLSTKPPVVDVFFNAAALRLP